MRIGIDAMGGDFGPEVMVPAGIHFGNTHKDVCVCFYGNRREIERIISDNTRSSCTHSITESTNIPADYTLDMRRMMDDYSESSIVKMSEDLKNGEIDGVLSAGNTAAYVWAIRKNIGVILKRVAKMTLASEFPNPQKPSALALDMGANPNISPMHLVQYALLATEYLRLKEGDIQPVGNLNIGTESGKGMELHQEVDMLLKKLGDEGQIDYIGNVEPEALLEGQRKIVVGGAQEMNLVLKMGKATSGHIFSKIPFGECIQRYFNKSSGALMLGVNKPVAKANGNSDIATIQRTLQELYDYIVLNQKKDLIRTMADGYNGRYSLAEIALEK